MGGPAWAALSLPSNCVLAAYALGDMIMLKPIDIPTENDFKASLDQFASWAEDVGYKESNVDDIVKSYSDFGSSGPEVE